MTTRQSILVIATSLVILFIGAAFSAQQESSDTILIRSTQIIFGGRNKSFLRIYKGNNQIEKLPLEKWQWEDEELNFDKILTTVQGYEKQGYRVISHSEVMFGTNGFVNTFVLTKR